MMHFLAGWIALGCGLLNLLGGKGTTGHRALGLLFAISMCLVAIEALSRTTRGVVDLFVVLALTAVGLTIWALLPFAGRRPGWVARHARRMQVTYICLAAAAGNEVLSLATEGLPRLGVAPAWLSIAITLLIAAGGWWLAKKQDAEIHRVNEDSVR